MNDRSDPHSFLRSATESLFEEAVRITGIDKSHLPSPPATRYERAIALVELARSAEREEILYGWIAEQRRPPLRRRSGAPAAVAPQAETEIPASRAPIVIALETADRRLEDNELLPMERHLTVTLSGADLRDLERASAELDRAESLGAIEEVGLVAWEALTQAAPDLEALLKSVRAAAQDRPNPQPIAWTGRLDLLETLHRSVLAARQHDPAHGLISVNAGAHFFHPLASPGATRSMRRRDRRDHGGVQVRSVEATEAMTEDALRREMLDAVAAEIVSISGPDLDLLAGHLVDALLHAPHGGTRVMIGFGRSLAPDRLDLLLRYLPCVSLAGAGLQRLVAGGMRRAVRAAASSQAIPVILAAQRARLLEQLHGQGNVAAFREALCWSTWSWVGRPLFSNRFGEVPGPAYRHLMDLRSVASRDWYFDRSEGIPQQYQAAQLARPSAAPANREESSPENGEASFHLYLSGAGGTGKSCFLRCIYETLDVNHPQVLPVWYKVDAPSSDWQEVERRIKQELRKALEHRFENLDPSPMDERLDLRVLLRSLVEKLRATGSGIKEIALFIDQLERTFESGDNPEPDRLARISRNVMQLLKEVSTGQGVRVFIASRKQYLPDFLSSFQEAEDTRLHFYILQQIGVDTEQVGFVRKALAWCRANRLVSPGLDLDDAAARGLAASVVGHPLNMMLALIQLFSQRLTGEIGRADIERLRPWEKLFSVDEELAAKDDLDWYFFLALAHARTEIVRFEEVWWRLRLVSLELTERADHLGRKGVLERLWLLGHLGRSIHPRPLREDEAGFLEFFHANLRDHLVSNVMNYGQDDSARATRRRGMPAAWRAIDRLREAARDWRQSQPLLLREDITVLMEHRDVFVERIAREGGQTQVEAFYLLFMRDAREHRDELLQAAKECVVYAAIAHDVLGRWAFARLFADPQEGAECCRRWLRRSDRASRRRILQCLSELGDDAANRLLAELVFDERPEAHEVWQLVAGIFADPLVAATHRIAFLTVLIRHLLDAGHSFPAENPATERFGAFLAATCGGEPLAVAHLLASLSEQVTGLRDPRLEQAVQNLASEPARLARWTDPAAAASDPALGPTDLEEPAPEVELRAGAAIRARVQAQLPAWEQTLAARIGIAIPPISISDGEVALYRRVAATEPAIQAPSGCELQLLIRGSLIALGDFHPELVQTLVRDQEAGRAEPPPRYLGFNDALHEPVAWFDPAEAESAGWTHAVWNFDAAAIDWLELLLRREVSRWFSLDEVPSVLRDAAAKSRGRIKLEGTFRALAEVFYPVWLVLMKLVRERVPLSHRKVELVQRLQELVRRERVTDPVVLTQRLREHVGADLCRTFAGEANVLALMLLEPGVEAALARSLLTAPGLHKFNLATDDARAFAGAVMEHFERAARQGHRNPVLVCEDHLRSPLYEMLQVFDPRLDVLGYTELSPDVRLVSTGVIRRVALSPQSAASTGA